MDHGISGFSSENFSVHSEGGRPKLEKRCLSTKSKHYIEKLLDSGWSRVDEGECSSSQGPITEVPGDRRGGQLPPEQAEYPPLPRPGDRPLVVCQHCSTFLVVETNLPPPRKSTQTIICVACMRRSIFSVPRHSTDQESVSATENLVDYRRFSHENNQQQVDEQNSKGLKSDSLLGEIREEMGEDYSRVSDVNSSSSPPSLSTLTSPACSSSTLTSPASRERQFLTRSNHYSETILGSSWSKVDEGECSSCQELIPEVPDGCRRGQLPPKQEEYPSLPRPDGRPFVVCQHCSKLLVVRTNLPLPRKSTQKLRCVACMRVSIFSVPRHSTDQDSYGTQEDLVDYRRFSHENNQQQVDEQNSKGSKSDSLLGEIREGMGQDYSYFSDVNSSSSPPSSSTLTSPPYSSSTLTSPASRERSCLTSKHYSEKLLGSGWSKVDEGECSSCQEPITEVPDGRRRGRLPPKQEEYPSLPRPDGRPHVICQHCFKLLVVPTNLPLRGKSTQKLRCGACMRISIFSVPRHSTDQESVQHGVLSKPGHHDSRLLSRGKQVLSGSNCSSTSGADYGTGTQSQSPPLTSLKQVVMSPKFRVLMKLIMHTLFDVSPAGAFLENTLDFGKGLPASTDSKKQSSKSPEKVI